MSINYSIEVEDDLLRVTASGVDDNLEQVQEYGMAVIGAAIEYRVSKILCNEKDLKYLLGTFDTYESARLIAEAAPKIAQVAIVCKDDDYKDAQFWETVASNRGLHIRVFKDLATAEEWLK